MDRHFIDPVFHLDINRITYNGLLKGLASVTKYDGRRYIFPRLKRCSDGYE